VEVIHGIAKICVGNKHRTKEKDRMNIGRCTGNCSCKSHHNSN